MSATVGVECEPDVSADVSLEDKDVMAPNSRHFRSWRGAWEAKPIRREIQRWNDASEKMDGCAAAAKGPWAAGGTTSDDVSGIGRQRQREKRYRRENCSQHVTSFEF